MAGNNQKIRTQDFVENNGDLSRIYQELLQVSEAYDALIQKVKKDAVVFEQKVKSNTGATIEQRQAMEDSNEEVTKLYKELKKYNESLKESSVKIAATKEATRQMNQVNKLQAKLAASAEGSYNKLSAQYSLNKIALNQMSAEMRNSTKEGQQLEKETAAIYEEMKRLQEATGKHVLSVGDYGKALRDLPGPLGQLTDGVEAVSDGFKAMLANPVVLVLGLIAGALAAVYKAFMQTERGASLMNKAMGYAQGIWTAFVGIVDRAVDAVVAFTEDPIGGIQDFGESLLKNIVNRFKAIIDLGGVLGRVLKSLWERDMEGLKNAARDAGTAFIQLNTGMDVDQQREFAEAVAETAKEVSNTADAFAKLYQQQRETVKANRALTVQAAKLRAEYELLQAIANDDTQGYKQQQEAIDKATEARARLAEVELAAARNSLSVINKEVALRRAAGEEIEDLLDRQADAVQQVIGAESEYTLAVRDNAELRRKVRRDEFERELDYAIDVGDAQKSLIERQLKDESLSLQQRAALLDEVKNVDASRFESQKQLVSDYLGFQLDFDSLVRESNEAVIRDKLRGIDADDIVQGRILEIIRDRKAAFQDLIEVERDAVKERNKALGLDTLELLPTDSIDTAQGKRLLKQAVDEFQAYSKELTAQDGGFWSFLQLDDNTKQGLMSALSFIKNQFSELLAARVELADRAVEAANKELDAATTNLEQQQAAKRAGEAADLEAAEKQFREAKGRQQRALNEQQKAVKAQQAIQTIEQTSNMITASSKIWSSLAGTPPLAIAAIALMWGSFIASKVKASQLAKREYGQGGYEYFDYGAAHGTGNDIPLGVTKDGKQRMVERNESFAVFSKRANSQYGNILPALVKAANTGSLEQMLNHNDAMMELGFNYMGPNMGKTESELTKIRKQGDGKKIYQTKKGYAVVSKNRTTYYNEN